MRVSEDLIQTSRRKLLPKIIERAHVTYVLILFYLFPAPLLFRLRECMELYRFEPLSWCLVWPVMKRLLDTSSPDQPLLITIVLLCTAVLTTYNQVCITAFLALLAS